MRRRAAAAASASRYAAKIELDRISDPHVLAVGRVPANSSVLNLGVADGSVASVLRAMGCHVWGVEIDRWPPRCAKRICEDVAVEDLNQLDFASRFEGRRFDVVLMLDVLEHLPDPAAVLRHVGSVLAEGGWAVISLPNVAHVSVRLSLLEGRSATTTWACWTAPTWGSSTGPGCKAPRCRRVGMLELAG